MPLITIRGEIKMWNTPQNLFWLPIISSYSMKQGKASREQRMFVRLINSNILGENWYLFAHILHKYQLWLRRYSKSKKKVWKSQHSGKGWLNRSTLLSLESIEYWYVSNLEITLIINMHLHIFIFYLPAIPLCL